MSSRSSVVRAITSLWVWRFNLLAHIFNAWVSTRLAISFRITSSSALNKSWSIFIFASPLSDTGSSYVYIYTPFINLLRGIFTYFVNQFSQWTYTARINYSYGDMKLHAYIVGINEHQDNSCLFIHLNLTVLPCLFLVSFII